MSKLVTKSCKQNTNYILHFFCKPINIQALLKTKQIVFNIDCNIFNDNNNNTNNSKSVKATTTAEETTTTTTKLRPQTQTLQQHN
jgi:hypothetical protein